MFAKRLFAVAVLLLPGTLVLAQDADGILAKVDSVLQAAKDMKALEKMTLIDKTGKQKDREIRIFTKGNQLRLIQFIAPADVRGVGFLRLSADRLYLYLPAFRKVRRIASSVKHENFMGTDFSYEDMSQTEYQSDYTAVSLPAQNGQFVLELKPKPGANVSYGRLILFVDQNDYVYRRIEFYDKTDRLQKILTADRVEKIDGYWIAGRMEMRTLKNGHRTILEMKNVKFNNNFADSFFSQRNLKRTVR